MTGHAERDILSAVREAEDAVRPALAEWLRTTVRADERVSRELRSWADLSGDDLETAIDRAASRQANVLTNHVRYRVAVGAAVPAGLRDTPVTPFEGFETPASVDDALETLESTLADVDAPDVAADLLGARYAEVLSGDERRTRGQFYTPPTVSAAVSQWALAGADRGGSDDPPRVLDPAAGTGTFPLAAYDCLRARNPEVDQGSLLSRLVAVDVDGVALHLAALGLSARSGGRPVETFDRRARSFFDLEPEGGQSGATTPDGTVPLVDAVVGNPPFVRAGDLSPGRAHFREHLDAFGAGGETPYADGDRALSRRSDAYVYFVTHATRFLRPGGRLGMVLPAKWLESDYGADFRRFLVDQYRVRAVVGFGARAFDALVDTVLLLAERRERSAGRGVRDREGPDGVADVSFVRLQEPLAGAASLAELVAGDASAAPALSRNGSARVVRRDHSTFAAAEKCSPYLRAPEALLSLLDDSAFVRLGDLARVSRGVTTGANRFFLVDADDRARWGIDADLLRPAVRSIRGVDSRTVAAPDVDLSVVDVHGFLAERLDREGASDAGAVDRAKDALRGAGHGSFVDYVEHAESRGWHEGRTCRARRFWFDLGRLPTPDAFVPKLLRERVFTVRNAAGAVPTNAIDCLSVDEDVDPDVLLGALDSSLCRAMMEIWGRNEAGMLQLMTYETRTLPVPDVRAFSTAEAATIGEAAADLDADGTGQAALDDAVHAALDVELAAEDARAMRERLLDRRIGGGDRVEVPVSDD